MTEQPDVARPVLLAIGRHTTSTDPPPSCGDPGVGASWCHVRMGRCGARRVPRVRRLSAAQPRACVVYGHASSIDPRRAPVTSLGAIAGHSPCFCCSYLAFSEARHPAHPRRRRQPRISRPWCCKTCHAVSAALVLAVTKRGPVLLLRSQHMRGCGVLGSADAGRAPERRPGGGATRVGSSQSVAARGADMSWRESGWRCVDHSEILEASA